MINYMVLYAPTNGGKSMKISVFIDDSFEENFLMVDGDEFIFTFETLEAYDKFLKKRLKVNSYSMNDYEISSDDAKKLDQIYDNPKELANLPINITILDLSQISILKDAKYPLLVDISNLSIKDTITLLNSDSWEKHRFYDKYNTLHEATKEELLRTYEKIENIANKIKEQNLSPLEILMFIFDYTRQRIYTLSKEDDVSKSRDLSHILEEEEIVCKGYANIFCSLCEFLNIKADVITWKSTNYGYGHASVLTFVNDSKYDVHAIYAFDPTWGSKKSSNDTKYLYSYKQALIPLEKEFRYKADRDLEILDFKTLKSLQTRFNNYEKFREMNAPQAIIDGTKESILDGINKVRSLLGINPAAKDRLDDVYMLYQELKGITENTMPMEVFERLMINVRTFENKIDPNTYPLDEHTISIIKINSQSYRPRQNIEVPQELLRKLFGK